MKEKEKIGLQTLSLQLTENEKLKKRTKLHVISKKLHVII